MTGSRNSLYLYAYDLSNNKERRKVDKLLSGYGFRRQKSVFLCRLTRGARKRLESAMEALHLQTGFILSVPVAGQTKIGIVGEAPQDPDANHCFMV